RILRIPASKAIIIPGKSNAATVKRLVPPNPPGAVKRVPPVSHSPSLASVNIAASYQSSRASSIGRHGASQSSVAVRMRESRAQREESETSEDRTARLAKDAARKKAKRRAASQPDVEETKKRHKM
ncbi:hypothetical protein PENTCL1PPCAC_20066, partial [Pristionchus entomophagus]